MAGLPKLCPKPHTSLAFWIFNTADPPYKAPTLDRCLKSDALPLLSPSGENGSLYCPVRGEIKEICFTRAPSSTNHQPSRATLSNKVPTQNTQLFQSQRKFLQLKSNMKLLGPSSLVTLATFPLFRSHTELAATKLSRADIDHPPHYQEF